MTETQIHNAETQFGVPMALLRKATCHEVIKYVSPNRFFREIQIGWLEVSVHVHSPDLATQIAEFGPVAISEDTHFIYLYFEPINHGFVDGGGI